MRAKLCLTIAFLSLVGFITWVVPNVKAEDSGSLKILSRIIVEESLRTGISPEAVAALVLEESGFRPYALHISVPQRIKIGWKLAKENVSYSFYRRKGRNHYVILSCSKKQAHTILRWLTKRVPWANYDVGLMQVNKLKIKDFKLRPWDLLDPRTNVRIGISILSKCLKRSESFWGALECYRRGERYAGGESCNRRPCSQYGMRIARNLKIFLEGS